MSKHNHDQRKKTSDSLWVLIAFFVIAVALIPLLSNLLLNELIPPDNNLKPADWLGFWGSYLGGLFGSMAALIALYVTRKQSKQLQEENKEAHRLSVMPALNFSTRAVSYISSKANFESCFIFSPEKEHVLREIPVDEFENARNDAYAKNITNSVILIVSNYGMGPAMHTEICYGESKISLGGIKDGQFVQYEFLLSYPRSNDHLSTQYDLEIRYLDILGNCYSQTQTVKVSGEDTEYCPTTPPTLCKIIESYTGAI